MFREKYRTYINWGITAAAIITACTAFYFLVLRWNGVLDTFRTLNGILAPFIWGAIIAFVLDSLVVAISSLLEKLPPRKRPITDRRRKITRNAAIVLSEVIFITLLTVLIQSIVPQVIDSLRTLVSNFDRYADNLDKWAQVLITDYPAIQPYYKSVSESFSGIETIVSNFVKNDLLRVATSSLVGAGTYLYIFFIGMIVSIYMLIRKTHLLAMARKLLCTVARADIANLVLRESRRTVRVFKGYLVGKLLDSLIIGVLCFIGVSVFGVPYPLLISIIVGVTNIIPSFGPVIGAVPSAFLVLMVDPMKCLIFIIFIIVLQQLDGNLIGPRILGNSTGVSALGVLFAIVMGGGLFGVPGMILSVPSYAVIYNLIKRLAERRLSRKGLPTETSCYVNLDAVSSDAPSAAADQQPDAPAVRDHKNRGKRGQK